MEAWQAMYWRAAKIDGRTVGTLALPIFNQSTWSKKYVFSPKFRYLKLHK